MSDRVVLARWTPGDAQGEKQAREMMARMCAGAPWTCVFDRRGAALWRRGANAIDAAIVLPAELGAVFGVLFRRNEGKSTRVAGAEIEVDAAYALAEGGGTSLLEAYWGNYLAVLADRGSDSVHVLRDPAGSWPAFYALSGRVRWVFTHASDFIRASGGATEIDPLGIQLFLAQSRLPMARTTIAGVAELLPGQRLTLARDTDTIAPAWRPQPKGRGFKFGDIVAARDGMRSTLVECAGAWRSVADVVAHRLSGGLDSSVTLAALCVAGGPEGIVCLNERPWDVPEGDEAAYARLVAGRHGVKLVEVEQRPEQVNYCKVLSIECGARPSVTELSFGSAGFIDAALACRASVVTSGRGGDQIFQRSGAEYFPYDAFDEGLSLEILLERIVDAAMVSRKSAWSVLATTLDSLARGYYLGRGGVIGANPFWGLGVDADIAAEHAAHPWSTDALRASPARARLIRQMADLAYYHRPSLASATLIQASFIASQPMIEWVLRIPAYFQTMGGCDRSLVRAAFADDLPQEILQRKTKGDTTRHFARVIERNRSLMREILIDGELVRAGLIDRGRIERALDGVTVTRAEALSALLNAFVAETWLRRFRGECAAAAQQSCLPEATAEAAEGATR